MLLFSLLLSGIWSLTLGAETETVTLKLLSAREDSEIKRIEFTAFGNTYNFKFRKAPLPVTSDYFVRSYRNVEGFIQAVDYKPNLEALKNYIYYDPEAGASVKLEDTASGIKLEGILNEELRITPSLDFVAEDGSPAHDVKKLTFEETEYMTAYADEVINAYEPPTNFSYSDEMGRQSPSCVTVELCQVSDFDHQKNLGTDEQATMYHAVFINALILRFAALSNPNVSVVLTSVVRNKDTNSQPYIERNRRRNGVVTTQALYDFRDYFNKNRGDLKYDACLLLTGLDLAAEALFVQQKNVAGVAFLRSACSSNRYGISEDTGGAYDGVHFQTHELGHIMGSEHDGSGQGSACPSNAGYIMGSSHPSNKKFSPCSKAQITNYIRSSNGKCLSTRDSGAPISNPNLPGQTVTRQKRCELLHPDQAGVESYRPRNAKDCTLYCRKGSSSWEHEDADGQECAPNKYCRLGVCEAPSPLPGQC